MQEEVENRTLTLVVSGTKFTGRLLKAAISKYMAHCKEKKPSATPYLQPQSRLPHSVMKSMLGTRRAVFTVPLVTFAVSSTSPTITI